MKIDPLQISDVLLITPDVFGDSRGFFLELWNQKNYSNHGQHMPFVQDNVSKSAKGVLRGLHYQWPNPQGKLVSVLMGEVFDVAVDIRQGSPTFGQWVGATLSASNHQQLYIPPGFAHGFEVLSDEGAIFTYKCTALYTPEHDHSILWNDPAIGIKWNTQEPMLSGKDKNALTLASTPSNHLPTFPV